MCRLMSLSSRYMPSEHMSVWFALFGRYVAYLQSFLASFDCANIAGHAASYEDNIVVWSF